MKSYEEKVQKKYAKVEEKYEKTDNWDDYSYYGGFLDGMEWMAKTAKKCAIQNMTEAIDEHEEEIQRLKTEHGEDIATFINNRKFAIKTLKKIRKALKRELKSGKIFENML